VLGSDGRGWGSEIIKSLISEKSALSARPLLIIVIIVIIMTTMKKNKRECRESVGGGREDELSTEKEGFAFVSGLIT
jgi:hypothetical protein